MGLGPKQKFLALAAAIVLANLLVYGQTISFAPVHLDEPQLVIDQWRHLKADGTVADAFRNGAFRFGNGVFYRPILTLSLMADARLSGEKFDAATFHRGNLAIHGANALLCFALLLQLARGTGLAAAGALLFSLHPALAAATGWIPGRNDSLLFTFTALALLFLTEAARRRNATFFMLHLAAFFIALLTKETAVALLPLFPAWVFVFAKDVKPPGRRMLRVAAASLSWGLCAVAYLALRMTVLKDAPAIPMPGLHDLLFKTAVYAAYVFLPLGVPVFAWFQDLPSTRVALVTAIGLLLLAAAWWRSGRNGLIPCAVAAGALFIIPSAFSDRFLPHRLYLPVFFFTLAATEAARAASPAKKVAPLALAAVALCFGGVTARDLRRFKSPDVFWQSVNENSPSCGEALYELGYAAQMRADLAGAQRYYLKVITENPAILDARNNLGIIYKKAGRYDEALRLYEEELKLAPGRAYVIGNIGNLMVAKGDCRSAVEYYKRQLAAEPGIRRTYDNLVSCLLRIGDIEEATRYKQIALTLKD